MSEIREACSLEAAAEAAAAMRVLAEIPPEHLAGMDLAHALEAADNVHGVAKALIGAIWDRYGERFTLEDLAHGLVYVAQRRRTGPGNGQELGEASA